MDFAQFYESAYQSQYQSQWCWAASISMMFSFYGHYVYQGRIVSEAYGSEVNMPAAYGGVISQQINRDWYDDSAQPFYSRLTGLYDHDAGIYQINNQHVIAALHRGEPLIIGAGSHAMVLTAVGYYQDDPNLAWQEAGVFDPWPGNGARQLMFSEFVPAENGGTMRYLATVQVGDGNVGTPEPPPPQPSGDDSGYGSGGGSFGTGGLLVLFLLLIQRRAVASSNR